MEEEGADNKSSEHWIDKYDKAISALENCEKSKKLLEKQHEELRQRDEEKRNVCEKLTAEIKLLEENFKGNGEDMEKHELIQRMSNMENELSAGKDKAAQYERKLEEKEATIKQLIEEMEHLNDFNERSVSKSKDLEELGIELDTAKEHLESKILLYETELLDKDTEIKQLEKKLQFQAAVFEELQMTVVNMTGELSNLKEVLEENQLKKMEISQSLIDMRKSFTSKNEQLAEECYSQALELTKAYNDCDAYCRKIEELESALVGAQKESNTGMDISRETPSFKEEDLQQFKAYDQDAKNRMAELEDQISSYREEIQNLRGLITTERSTRLELEEQLDRRDTECKLHMKKINMFENEAYSLTKGLESDTKEKHEAGSLGELEEPRKHQTCDVKCEELAGEGCMFKNELLQLRGKCLVLANKNEELKAEKEWLSSIYEETKAESCILKADVEKLKQHMLKLRENSIDFSTDEEGIDEINIHCDVLRDENTRLKKAVDDLKLEKLKLTKEIANIRKSMFKMKQEKTVSHSMIDELERKTKEFTLEKEDLMRKGEQMEMEYKERLEDAERHWMESLEEKERFYENELKKRDENGIIIRQLEERLRQKESQSEIKTKEIKRILLQYSDLKTEKVKSEVKIESLQVTGKTLSERVQTLESRVNELETQETELIKKLDEKEIEMRKLNEEWGRVALESVTELKKAMTD